MPKYTFYWQTGQREVMAGRDAADALNQNGIGHGALPALDFYMRGSDHKYYWDEPSRKWLLKGE